MKIVYIVYLIGGDVENNLEWIRKIVCKLNFNYFDIVLFVFYWFDCYVLDDNIFEERERGIKNDKELFNWGFIDELWLYGLKISNGMKVEI